MFSTGRSTLQLSSPSSAPVISPSTHPSGLSSLIFQAQQFKSQKSNSDSSSNNGKALQFQVKVKSNSSSPPSNLNLSDANLIRSIRVILNSPTSKSPSQLTGSLQSLINNTQQIVQSQDSSTRCSELYDKVQMEMEKAIGQLSRSLESDPSSSSSNPQSVEGRQWLDQLNNGWLEWCDRCVS